MKSNTSEKNTLNVKIYNGYGHTHNLIIQGHVLMNKPIIRKSYSDHFFINLLHIARLFFIRPVPNLKVMLQWENIKLVTNTKRDGFFKFEWKSSEELKAGWHTVLIHCLKWDETILVTTEGKIFIPHSTQYAFISDIDDTVLVSHSTSIIKKLSILFSKNPRSRSAFSDVVNFYSSLSLAHTNKDIPNPFFYVSGSEWNLYDYLDDFFDYNGFPEGIFLLSHIKHWYQLLKTGEIKRQRKLLRITRILEVFPKQKFVLLGDNSQNDLYIYTAVAQKFPKNIHAVFIRNIRQNKDGETSGLIMQLQEKGIHFCLFQKMEEAINYSKTIGLLN